MFPGFARYAWKKPKYAKSNFSGGSLLWYKYILIAEQETPDDICAMCEIHAVTGYNNMRASEAIADMAAGLKEGANYECLR